MNQAEEIDKIKRRLFPLGQSDDALINELYDSWKEQALSISHRKELNAALAALVREAVVSAFIRRGDEGVSSSSLGGQSYSYEDIWQKLFDAIVQSGLRVMA